MEAFELNLDGFVGPTHHYAGLSVGNLASTHNALKPANPRAAALQSINKMRLLYQLGLKQAFLPPHLRPNITLLRQLGFSGNTEQILKQAKKEAPDLLSACFSASGMWTANAATISPSTDTKDNRVHFTAANLISNLHRHQETAFTRHLLQLLFADETYFYHHPPLPNTLLTRDEGAANHNRLCKQYGAPGIHLFVYNQQMLPTRNKTPVPKIYPARQTREASEAIVRGHQLPSETVIYAQQNPSIVDKGVFHNDVISLANENLFLLHEQAFVNQEIVLNQLVELADFPIHFIKISNQQMSVEDAINSYFFNSQLITLNNHTMALISPIECQSTPSIKSLIDNILADPTNPINQAYYLDLKQSMQNGGGPACLRLRVVLNEKELKAMNQNTIVDDNLLNALENFVNKHYRDHIEIQDLSDPEFIKEIHTTLDNLSSLLQLGSIYPFQLP